MQRRLKLKTKKTRMHCSQFQNRNQGIGGTPEESSHKIRWLSFCLAPPLSFFRFFPSRFFQVRRQVCNSISLLFNPQPFVCARDLCTTFVLLHLGAFGGIGTIRPQDNKDAPLNNNYDNNKSEKTFNLLPLRS